jgi:hypothetical protein
MPHMLLEDPNTINNGTNPQLPVNARHASMLEALNLRPGDR